jgi:hypothetical protein
MRLTHSIAALLAAGLLATPAPARAQAPALAMVVAGPPVAVFAKARDACDPDDIPDAPARAVRLESGRVLLFAAHFRNRVSAGPDLLHLRHDCRIVLAGAESADPARFDDRSWIAATWTPDGHRLFAVLHDEFQGHRHVGLCPTGRYMECWYNALTLAASPDGGASFARLPGLVAALPYRYDQLVGSHHGYFNPSNIVSLDGALYMTVFATRAEAQAPGNCLLRTDDIADPGAWRAWDGMSFGARFIDPYRERAEPARHVCTPVGTGQLRWPVTSLVRHAPSRLFVATMQDGARNGGVWYATSADLLRWSMPARLMPATGLGAWQTGDPPPLAYPSVLDPAGTDANFQTVGAAPLMYATRFNGVTPGHPGMDRDLIAIPLRIGRP